MFMCYRRECSSLRCMHGGFFFVFGNLMIRNPKIKHSPFLGLIKSTLLLVFKIYPRPVFEKISFSCPDVIFIESPGVSGIYFLFCSLNVSRISFVVLDFQCSCAFSLFHVDRSSNSSLVRFVLYFALCRSFSSK